MGVVKKLGIKHKERSIAVKRALTDFGAEESLGQAAKRFQEHYGWTVERGAIRREVEAIAFETEYYVENRVKVLKRRCYGIFDVGHIFQRLTLDIHGYERFSLT